MKTKEWKIMYAESCPNCGGNVEVLSECPEGKDTDTEQWFMDEEDVRCAENCGFESCTMLDEDSGFVGIQEGNRDELEKQQTP